MTAAKILDRIRQRGTSPLILRDSKKTATPRMVRVPKKPQK